MRSILTRSLLHFGCFGCSLVAAASVCNSVPVTDASTGQRWARVVDCDHPEWPAKLVPLGEAEKQEVSAAGTAGSAAPVSRPAPVVIHAGTTVNLWSHAVSGLHLTGVALETASFGQTIHVRGGLGAATLRGIVRGPDSVELLAPGWERKQ